LNIALRQQLTCIAELAQHENATKHLITPVWHRIRVDKFGGGALTIKYWRRRRSRIVEEVARRVAARPVSRDIVSSHKSIRGDELIYPPGWNQPYSVSPLKLKLDIKHKMLMLHVRSVNVYSFRTLLRTFAVISLIYISFFSGPQFRKLTLKT